MTTQARDTAQLVEQLRDALAHPVHEVNLDEAAYLLDSLAAELEAVKGENEFALLQLAWWLVHPPETPIGEARKEYDKIFTKQH